jgi:hypothetical protein
MDTDLKKKKSDENSQFLTHPPDLKVMTAAKNSPSAEITFFSRLSFFRKSI